MKFIRTYRLDENAHPAGPRIVVELHSDQPLTASQISTFANVLSWAESISADIRKAVK